MLSVLSGLTPRPVKRLHRLEGVEILEIDKGNEVVRLEGEGGEVDVVVLSTMCCKTTVPSHLLRFSDKLARRIFPLQLL